MMDIFVFTQNLKLCSLQDCVKDVEKGNNCVILTTHFLFENERSFIKSILPNCVFKTFADYLTDDEMARCDTEAFLSRDIAYIDYLTGLKRIKNSIVAEKVIAEYSPDRRFLLSDDLGIDEHVWLGKGFKRLTGTYYYTESSTKRYGYPLTYRIRQSLSSILFLKRMYRIGRRLFNQEGDITQDVYVAEFEGKKYVFIGKMNRIDYRLSIEFRLSEKERKKLVAGCYDTKESCVYMTTWHEHFKCNIPDNDRYAVRWAQDGYLPPNYTHKDYFFKPRNVVYYCWDELGTRLFKNQGLPYEMIPFRRKLYLPNPVFPRKLRNILVVASGSGDWTALKNRSDDDLMVDAFAQIAKRFPMVHITYRCHPTWVHPLNVGVNSINRVFEYFESLALPNLKLSSNIPLANSDDGFQYSFTRNSLDEDLKNTDFVFGEHSISMIDAAFQGIPFCSVNLTNRRNFFIGITDLGFPSCTSISEIERLILNIGNKDFQETYVSAVQEYNKMTDCEV